MNYLITFSASFLLFVVIFLIGKSRNKHDLIDIIWGLSPIVASLVSLLLGGIDAVKLVLTLIVAIWGIRLAVHIGKRNLGAKEDFRYVKYRQEYKGKHFDAYFFFRMYVLQFVLNMIVIFPVVFVNLQSVHMAGVVTIIGLVVWIIGFVFESVGDHQLKVFKSNPNNKGKLITTGFYKYTRHPNYFGEATMWWGICIICLSNGNNYFLLFSPLIMTLLLRFVSGVPLLEKKYDGRPDWEEYKKKTSIFFPMLPKNN